MWLRVYIRGNVGVTDSIVSRSPDHAFRSLFIMLTSSCRGKAFRDKMMSA